MVQLRQARTRINSSNSVNTDSYQYLVSGGTHRSVTATAATRGFRYGYVHEITAVHIVDSARAMVDRLEFEVMKHLE